MTERLVIGFFSRSEYYTTTDSLAHIVTDDIGAFAVAAFLNPDKFNGREIELVGEHLTADQIVEALEAASGTLFILSHPRWRSSLKGE